MRIIIREDYNSVCNWVSEYIKNKINLNNDNKFVLGLPTGSTPLGVYQNMMKLNKLNELSFKNVVTFNMDEYVNLSKDDPQSYNYYMRNNFFNHVDIPESNINLLDGNSKNLQEECDNYERKIRENGNIDLFLCGVGSDGHLAFNEPGSSLSSRTRIKTLCHQTIKDNSRFFDGNDKLVPNKVLTVGMGTVYDSKEIIVMVTGQNKAHALQKCIEEGVNHMFPASTLQNHNKVIFVCDEEATSELKMKTVKYFKSLQNTIDIMGNHIDSFYFDNIKKDDKIIIFSPHPDDDVIGCGGVLQLFPNKKNVLVVYMTSGRGGLTGNNSENIREKEALLSLKVLGYNENNINFLNLPFYDTENREISNKDTGIVLGLLNNFKPNHIFVCNDSDPKGTHKKCFNIIQNCMNESVTGIRLNCDFNVWLYKGAWNNWNDNNKSNCTVHLENNIFNLKKASILCHQSQDPPINTKDNKTFIDIASENNYSLDIFEEYQEKFKVLSIQDFLHFQWY